MHCLVFFFKRKRNLFIYLEKCKEITFFKHYFVNVYRKYVYTSRLTSTDNRSCNIYRFGKFKDQSNLTSQKHPTSKLLFLEVLISKMVG